MRLAIFFLGMIAAAQPAFEVASVRQTPPASIGYTSISPPGSATFAARNITMRILISTAYGIDSDYITSKQDWIDSERYDVTAKAEGGQGISSEQLKPMLQQLLAERFKLTVHRETKTMAGYLLVVAKGGPKLQPTKGAPARPAILKGALRADNISVDVLAGMLRRPLGKPVANQTGLTGNFDVTFDFAPEGAEDSALPSIFTAIQEQLGLKLVPQKVPVETLVIDHAERVPIQN